MSSDTRYCVYMHRNKINNKRYFGQTKHVDNPEKRWGINGEGYIGNSFFTNSINKYGWDNFEHIILFKMLDDGVMHVTELAAMAFIKDDDNRPVINRVIRKPGNKSGKLLDGRDENVCIGLAELFFQHGSGRAAVGSTFFKPVILTHSLIVKVFAVNDKQHLVDIIQLGCKPRCLE